MADATGYKLGSAFIDLGLATKSLESGLAGIKGKLSAGLESMANVAKKLAIGLAGIYTASTAAAMKSEEHTARLEAVLRSTSGAAGLMAGQLEELAKNLSLVTRYSKGAIVDMEAILLTFTKLKGPIFTEAVKAILDISSALGQDLQSAAIQVGKALNDPLIGMTALRRVGVSFSDQQMETVKYLVETNRLFEAQGLILKELETEFGGMSRALGETTIGSLARLKNSVTSALSAFGGPFLEGMRETFNQIGGFINAHIADIKYWGQVSAEIVNFVMKAFGQYADWLASDWKNNLATTLTMVKELFLSTFELIGAGMEASMLTALDKISAALEGKFTAMLLYLPKKLGTSFWNWMAKIDPEFKTFYKKQGDTVGAAFEQWGRPNYQPGEREPAFENEIREARKRMDDALKSMTTILERNAPELNSTLGTLFDGLKQNLDKIKKSRNLFEMELPHRQPAGFGELTQPIETAKIGFAGLQDMWKTVASGKKGAEDVQIDLLRDSLKSQKATEIESKETNRLLKNQGTTTGFTYGD